MVSYIDLRRLTLGLLYFQWILGLSLFSTPLYCFVVHYQDVTIEKEGIAMGMCGFMVLFGSFAMVNILMAIAITKDNVLWSTLVYQNYVFTLMMGIQVASLTSLLLSLGYQTTEMSTLNVCLLSGLLLHVVISLVVVLSINMFHKAWEEHAGSER